MRNAAILTILTMAAMWTPLLLACPPCLEKPSPCEAANHSRAILLGTVVRKTMPRGDAVLRVDHAYEGVSDPEVVVAAHLSLGEQYLVYANGGIGRLSPIHCRGAVDAADAADHLEFLRHYSSGASKTELSGVVLRNDGGGAIKGVRMVLSSAAGTYETETAGDGRFVLSGLAPGEYKIEGRLPGFDHRRTTFRVKQGACARAVVAMEPDRRVHGTVRTLDGQPATGVRVQLVQPGKDGLVEAVYSDETDADGNYAIRRVEPGEYELGINIFGTPLPSSPHVPAYWPGRKVFVPEGAAQLRHDWVEPERIRILMVRGRIVRRDGTPSPERPKLTLSGSDFREPVDMEIVPDVEGWFQFPYCQGQRFHIQGQLVTTEVKEGIAGDGKELVLVLI
ncbi:MAG: carboxypeptidase regulatory-like domain-containing protein [Acidobacteria bacterium]|nr:carboxypeptidase regulatory-like domain-containing protein [Acidobacteriota bacterium]